MPVPAVISDLSTTAGSNFPSGGDAPTSGDDVLRALSSFIAQLRDQLNGTANTGTVKNAALSGTMTGAAAFAALQSFAVGLNTGNSAQASATTLDWYEEGTFTPAAVGSSVPGVGTYAEQVGTFTRIGNRVFFEIKLTWTAHTGSGNVTVSGLPYAFAQIGSIYGEWRTGSDYAPARANVLAAATTTQNVQETLVFSKFTNISLVTGTGGLYFVGHYRV